jgi:hypothetical protein
MELTQLENEFIKIYEHEKFEEIKNYMINNNIFDVYLIRRNNNRDLLLFAIKFGLMEIAIIIFCKTDDYYDLNKIFCEFYHLNTLSKGMSEETEKSHVPIIYNFANREGWCVDLSWDKFSNNRKQVISYLNGLKKFSSRNYTNGIDYYKFNHKYEKNCFI